jgi:hypothetical protein
VAVGVLGVILTLLLLGLLAVPGDWDGTPYRIHNGCDRAISVDNGHDSVRIDAGATMTLPGFSDLRLSIRLPVGEGGTSTSATFTASPVEIAGRLCPT